MNIKDVYDLLDRFENSSLSELQLELEGAKLLCKKQNDDENIVTVVKSNKEIKNIKPTLSEEKIEKVTEEKVENVAGGIEVKAKIAGTFYRAPSPDSEPFVQVGQKVKKGDVIGLIEAMKMMNDIVAPEDGVITQIVATNEELVSYDDVLIVIDGGK